MAAFTVGGRFMRFTKKTKNVNASNTPRNESNIFQRRRNDWFVFSESSHVFQKGVFALSCCVEVSIFICYCYLHLLLLSSCEGYTEFYDIIVALYPAHFVLSKNDSLELTAPENLSL